MCQNRIKENCEGEKGKLIVVWHGETPLNVCLPCAMTMVGFCTTHLVAKQIATDGSLYCMCCIEEIPLPPATASPEWSQWYAQSTHGHYRP